ncbi:MAG: outer membrane beta-barrel protein, partial [Verrucomicrobia bacterium]|nr:outer membrane beta-barrel protein [Verrucomicrobiota bacterium]
NSTTHSTPTKADGFNLDAVEVTISKALDESEWASGYMVQLVYGQDASGLSINSSRDTSFDASIKQAYVTLRTPVGNGIDWKIGVWDTILGYESFDAGNNPNYTRSYGYGMEPTTYTGILASYKFCNVVSASVGVANTSDGASLGSRTSIDSRKAYLGSLALTAPESWGVLAGSTLYGAVAYGERSSATPAYHTVNYYAGAVVNTGIKGLKVGASYDYAGADANFGTDTGWQNAIAVYASFQATDKLSLHARGEYAWSASGWSDVVSANSSASSVYALTGTVQYDLWKNVLSRAEIRWDHAKDGVFGSLQVLI